jgi:flagellin-like hook-associated protein FlgL
MSIGGIGARSLLMVQSLVDMRAQLGDLQRQLATGRKSVDYAGVGPNRGLTVGLRSQLAAIGGYGETITHLGVRIDLAQKTLDRVRAIGSETKATLLPAAFNIDGDGQTTAQKSAQLALGELLALLNTRAGDRYLFSGAGVDRPAVDTLGRILDGEGARAGLRQLIDERNQADLGASGLGRLVVTAPTATSLSVAEDVAGSPFGFKLAAISTTFTGATANGPAGAPPEVTLDLGAFNPNAGEKVTFTFNLPDGSTETLTLTATNSASPGAGEFTLGANSTVTTANLQAALTGAIGTLARTALSAASAMAAAGEFFAIDDANPPQRVAGPPFDTATALTNGTPANTVSWYTGEAGSTPARQTAVARADQSISVAYGLRANEEGIRWLVQHVAVLAAVTYSPADADAAARNGALQSRLMTALDVPSGTQKVADIQSELAGAQVTLDAAKERHQQVSATLTDMLERTEGISSEEVAARILALQTSLQASLQTTAMLYQTNLIKYL